jgi:hypothetical protein
MPNLGVGGCVLAGCLDLPVAQHRGMGGGEDIWLRLLAGSWFWAARGSGRAGLEVCVCVCVCVCV